MADRVMYVNGNPIKLVDNGDGTFSESVKLAGSIPTYSWFDGDEEPTPTETHAYGEKFNVVTGEITVYRWTGTAWKEVV